jgi:hypothetical protein
MSSGRSVRTWPVGDSGTRSSRYGALSGKDDPGKRRVFDHPGLRVMAASPEHVFAMKASAARTRDIDDLRLLAGMIGVATADAALQICADFYPDEPIPPRTDAVLRELFG